MNQAFASMAGGMDIGEMSGTAITVALQGMLTIFSVLAILWGVIEIMHRALHKKKKDPKPPKAEKAEAVAVSASVPNPEDAAVAAAIAATLAAHEDSGATVAAITAAISATLAEEGHTGGFRVVSFKRVGTKKNRVF